jgi:hypothetical protein
MDTSMGFAQTRMMPIVDRMLRTGIPEHVMIDAFTFRSDIQTAFN